MISYEAELSERTGKDTGAGSRARESLFLHSCCAPCSSYVLLYLRTFFRITVFYYNPNITQQEEYEKRVAEQKRLIAALNRELEQPGTEGFPIAMQEGPYVPELFFRAVRGLETCPEGGRRCRLCFAMRLEETARQAKAGEFAYFTTTLTISPLKDAEVLNRIGQEMARRYGICFLPSDFKKRGGYQTSVLLSRTYDLYRQDYCGCIFSREQREKDREKRLQAED